MKRGFKKFGAFLLTAVMALAMNSTVFAAPSELEGGAEDGVAGTWATADTPIVQADKAVNIKKEIKVFNPTESLVYGPEIVYNYTVAAASGTELVTVTDEPGDHVANVATTATVNAGVTANLNVTGTSAGKIEWTNADILDASATGTSNYKDLTIDFSSVVFTQPGVYRYKISESVDAYTTSGVTDGTSSVAVDVRYLDVYVKRSNTYTDGSTAAQWDIYGFVCVADGETAVTPATLKTNGFVSVTDPDGDPSTDDDIPSDEYHTYNLTIGKTLSGDTTMNTHEFPFDIAFSNGTAGTATETFQFAVKKSGNATVASTDNAATTSVNGTTVAANALPTVGGADVVTTVGKDGNPTIANGATVTYIGIPSTIKATVTETNDVAGTTYATRAYADEGNVEATTQVGFTGGTADLADENNVDDALATVDSNETVIYAQAAAPTADTNQWIQVSNTLSIISPTGFVVRFAPYMLVLMGGIFLIVLGVVLYKRTNREEA